MIILTIIIISPSRNYQSWPIGISIQTNKTQLLINMNQKAALSDCVMIKVIV